MNKFEIRNLHSTAEKKEKFSSQFVFKNPNETERCGCGESFKI